MRLLKRIWEWLDDRTGASLLWDRIGRHPVPPGSKWWYVFGSATLVAFVIQVVTGIALATAYVPSTQNAYDSLQFITHQALWGHLLRGLHYFGAGAMVLMVGIHAAQVFLFGSYKFPRELNWLTGSILLLLTLAMAFTGQLLRWDQIAVWSVMVGAQQAGRVPFLGTILARFILAGDTVGGATLSRFFAFHVFFIPALIFAFVAFHLFLVLRHGISEPPTPGHPVDPKSYVRWYENMLRREGRPFFPDAAWRDIVFGGALVLALFVLALVVGPPELSRPPDPTILGAYPRPDWYFLWYFAVLALLPPAMENFVIVFGPLIWGFILIVMPFLFNHGERHPLRRPWAIGGVLVVVMTIGVFWWEGVKAPWSPDFAAKPLTANIVGSADPQIVNGAKLFHDKGCQYCHEISGSGGHRGPVLTDVGDRLDTNQINIRIANGGVNMPAFADNLNSEEMRDLVAFLSSRRLKPEQ